MASGLSRRLQEIFLWRDFTSDGKRIVTERVYAETEDRRRYLKERRRVVQGAGEVLRIEYYSPNSRKPTMEWIR